MLIIFITPHSVHCQGIECRGIVNKWNTNTQKVFGRGEEEMFGCHCSRFVKNEDLFSGDNWSVKVVQVVHANCKIIDQPMVVENYSDSIKFYSQRKGHFL
jgi:hypothetical protein